MKVDLEVSAGLCISLKQQLQEAEESVQSTSEMAITHAIEASEWLDEKETTQHSIDELQVALEQVQQQYDSLNNEDLEGTKQLLSAAEAEREAAQMEIQYLRDTHDRCMLMAQEELMQVSSRLQGLERELGASQQSEESRAKRCEELEAEVCCLKLEAQSSQDSLQEARASEQGARDDMVSCLARYEQQEREREDTEGRLQQASQTLSDVETTYSRIATGLAEYMRGTGMQDIQVRLGPLLLI